ncbi:hypothetical protein [Primorskyibacter sp. S187A]|uniref:hypothetical protein n=1 Tax=Primorskyibacter sp. S187A TaxID=3415130 RepID=UPI003C7E71C2
MLVLLALILPLIFTALLSVANQRSYLIEAQTSYLELEFTAQQPDWRLADALVCAPVAIPRLGATDPCGAAAAPEGPRGEVLPEWGAGDVLRLTIDPDGSLRITALSETETLARRGFVLVSPEGWDRSGALLLRAFVTLGQPLASGATRNYLWSGTWQAREAGRPAFLFGTATEAVKDGTFAAGTRVKILQMDEARDLVPAVSFGHVAKRSDKPVMDVSLVSEFSDARLSIEYDGVPQPVISKPSWVDITLKSPLLIAIATIFPILTSLGLVLKDMLRRFATDAEGNPAPQTRRPPSWHTRKVLRGLRRRR